MDLAGKRILIIKQSSLGDVVHALPVSHALKRCFPDCFIGWVVEKSMAPLVACDPSVDAVYPIHIPSTSDPDAGKAAWLHAFKATIKVLRQLRRQFRVHPYDLVLDLHASFRSGLLGRTNPGGTRIGFQDARELNTLFQNERIRIPPHIEHALEKNLLFCSHLGCTARKKDFYISSGPADEAAVDRFLRRFGVRQGTTLLYANSCARWQTKFWPATGWAELADRVREKGELLVFGGGPADQGFIREITASMRTEPLVAAGSLSLTETVALMKRSALYVGVDTGPMHMAAMAGIPVVALFGPTHPERVGPYGVEHVIVRNTDLDCLGCRRRSCDHLRCMKGIGVDKVMAAFEQLVHRADALPGGEHS